MWLSSPFLFNLIEIDFLWVCDLCQSWNIKHFSTPSNQRYMSEVCDFWENTMLPCKVMEASEKWLQVFTDCYLCLELFSYWFRPHKVAKQYRSEKCISPDDRKLFSVLRNCTKFSFPYKEKSSNAMIWQGEALSCEQKCSESSCPYKVQKQSCSEVSTSWSLLSWPRNLSTMLMWFHCCFQNPVDSRQSVKSEMGFNFGASWDRSRGYWASIVQGREDPVAETGKLELDAYHTKINKNPQHHNFYSKKKKKVWGYFYIFSE